MSGFAGILNRTRPADPDAAAGAAAALHHRMRQPPRLWAMGPAALAGDCLACAPNGAVIVADARLDNRSDIAARHRLASGASDAEIILAVYLSVGDECVSALIGDFAFAVWDPRRGRLFCARDHAGVRPFYLAQTAQGLVFASEIKALHRLGAGGAIDPAQTAAFLAGLPPETESTWHPDIRRLAPGDTLTLAQGDMRIAAWWRPALSPDPPAGDTAEQVRDLFTSAVRSRVSAGTGVMLSGGLDSSSIALAAAPMMRGAAAAFSIVDDGSEDERAQIDLVLGRGRFAAVNVPGYREGAFSGFDELLDEQDGLVQAPTLAAVRRLYAAAAGAGSHVLLDGHGGDEVVSHGLGRLKELGLAGNWLEVWRNAGAEADIYGASRAGVFLAYWSKLGPARRALGATGKVGRRLQELTKSGRLRPPPPWQGIARAEFAAESGVETMWRRAQSAGAAWRTEAEHHRAMLASPIQSHALEVLDHAAAHAGVEPRYPFWDRRLMEFCLSLPASDKLRNGWSRHVLREAMEGILPPAIQWRRDKFDFTRLLAACMVRSDRQVLDRVLLSDQHQVASYVDLPRVREAYARLTAQPGAARGADVQSVWRAGALALWLEWRPGGAKKNGRARFPAILKNEALHV